MSQATAIATIDSPVLDRDAHSPTLEQLASRVQAGCSTSFEELVHRSHPRVFQLLYQWCGNRSDAEDLAQDTFVKVWRSLPRYNPAQPFLPWIYTIARRTAANHFRHLSARPRTDPIPEGDAEGWASNHPESMDPSGALEAQDDADRFWLEARRLKPNHFRVLWLHYAENLSVRETAQIMGLTQIHVKVLLHRSRKQLAQRFADRNLENKH